jgi:uncharacterized protein (DUF2141 family)
MPVSVLTMLAAAGGMLTIDVGNVRNAEGVVRIDVCTQDLFLKDDCRFVGEAPARAGVTTVTVRDLPAGAYAIQAYHDENRNRKVDRNFIGLPKEGVGFSRDARIRLGPPKWADAVFAFDGQALRVALKLKYFTGASGPPAAR